MIDMVSDGSDMVLLLDVGKVLVGVRVPPSETQELDQFLKSLGYPCKEETANP